MKKNLFRVISLLICWLLLANPSVRAEEEAAKQAETGEPPRILPPDDRLPGVTARAAIVIEASTGYVLYEREADRRMFPASTTKMMTLIMALEDGRLDDIVTVSSRAAGVEGSTLWLERGEQMRMRDMLYGMMMVSGNDATVAVAEHISGTLPAFAKKMTRRARELGALHTNFTNSSGLPDENHYTTARDLACLAAHGFTLPEFEKIVSTKEAYFSWVHDPSHFLRNENQMLWLYDGVNGIKTGYTDAAGRCLISSAKRDGIQLIAVVLDALYMWNDSIALLDEGFRRVRPKQLIRAGTVKKTIPVVSGRKKTIDVQTVENLTLPEFDDGEAGYEFSYELPDKVSAPVKEGDRIGTLHILMNGKKVAETPLAASDSVEQKSFFKLIWKKLQELCGFGKGV